MSSYAVFPCVHSNNMIAGQKQQACVTQGYRHLRQAMYRLTRPMMICSAMIISGTMELVAMELKQSGYFLARTLSYEASLLLCSPATSLPMSFAHQYALQGIWIRKALGTERQIRAVCPCNNLCILSGSIQSFPPFSGRAGCCSCLCIPHSPLLQGCYMN